MTDTTTVRCTSCGKLNRIAVAAEGVPRCGNCHAALPWLVDATTATFDPAVDASMPVLVDFWAAWCGPCRMVSPIVAHLARQLAGTLKVVKVDIEANREVAARFSIQSIPQLVLFRDGREVDRVVGALPEPRLRAWVQERVGEPKPVGSSDA